ncbi:hypothetical protein R8510_02900 [Ralstonia chuxiongensis]|nr:hypothetical protein R8510_02900 [Ralstonia chuxiongensis]
MVRENVIAQLANLRTHPSVVLALEDGCVNLHSWVYDIETGSIDVLEGATRRFVALAEFPTTVAVTSRNLRQVWRRWPGAFGHRSLPGYALGAQCPPLEVILRGAV